MKTTILIIFTFFIMACDGAPIPGVNDQLTIDVFMPVRGFDYHEYPTAEYEVRYGDTKVGESYIYKFLNASPLENFYSGDTLYGSIEGENILEINIDNVTSRIRYYLAPINDTTDEEIGCDHPPIKGDMNRLEEHVECRKNRIPD